MTQPPFCNGFLTYRSAGFIASFIISMLTLIVCFCKLFYLNEGEDRSIYISLITFLLGIWTRVLKIKNNKKKDLSINGEDGSLSPRSDE